MASSGRYAEMEAAARELADAQPNSGIAWKALGVSLLMQGKQALQTFERAARMLPNDAEVHSNLGAALRRAGRLEDALTSLRRAIALEPGIAQVHNNLGNVLRDQGKLEQATSNYRRALALQPDYAQAHANLGILLRLQSRPAEAETNCRRALQIDPNLPEAVVLLAELHSDKGEFAAAEDQYNRLIGLDPKSAEAWAGLAGLRRMTNGDAGWLAQVQQLARSGLPPQQEANLRYAVGKYHDDVGNFEDAFHSYRRANELTKTMRPQHDRHQLTRAVDLIIESFDEDWLTRARVDSGTSNRPVFIVGMPRSGTTLAEQILASHHDVYGAGELPFWATTMSDWASRNQGEIGQRALLDLGDQYLGLLIELSKGSLRVVDKMPANFLYLGLIHAALPSAKIIHMRRNPIDTCLSIYFQNFGPFHSYANDLGDLAHYYSQYSRLMEHWRLNLPANAMLDLHYEKLVRQPELCTRRMLDFIGLTWDPSCLEFHRTRRTVSTFSKWQARQAINRSSIGRWRNYRKFAGPLLNLVESAGLNE
jgi:tetratricopeptide (TPR) repeat protein